MIAFMKRSYMLPVLFVLLLLAFPLAAQPADPTPAAPVREIYVALGFGDPVFEPEVWRASAAEQDDRTTAAWQSAEYGALGHAELLHFDGGYTPASLNAYFDADWFDVIFKDYDEWELTGHCTYDDVIVHEFALESDSARYLMRYWVQPITPTRVLAFHLVFPAASEGLLEAYSRLFAPLAYRCMG